MIRICEDAGHFGKYNQSPANKKYYESEAMWKLHLMRKKYLEEYEGVEVITTRDDQTKDLELTARGKKAQGCDLFISDHTNAVGSKVYESFDYVAVYHLTDDKTTTCDDESKKIAEKLAPVIAEVMGTKQAFKVLTRKASSDRNGDGIMNDNYYGVLHGARTVNVPGLILEHSFHTNTKITNWLLDDNNLEKLAKAEADVIAEHFGLKKPQVDENVLYRVQVGAYKVKANADAQLEKVKAAGFDTYMVQVDGLYKIQVGAYSKKENADAMLAKLKAAGFSAFITTKGGDGVAPSEPTVKKEIKVGSNVKVKKGAKTFTGGNLASFVYDRVHKVKEINVDRVVITYDGVVIAAIRKSDLTLVD